MIRYVWFDKKTGEFSDSWTEDEFNGSIREDLKTAKDMCKDGTVLIKYECLTKEQLKFSHLMRIS